ncbi:MAG: hypothetical protein ABI811_12090 [Acidobacteriota bacterium]
MNKKERIDPASITHGPKAGQTRASASKAKEIVGAPENEKTAHAWGKGEVQDKSPAAVRKSKA